MRIAKVKSFSQKRSHETLLPECHLSEFAHLHAYVCICQLLDVNLCKSTKDDLLTCFCSEDK